MVGCVKEKYDNKKNKPYSMHRSHFNYSMYTSTLFKSTLFKFLYIYCVEI